MRGITEIVLRQRELIDTSDEMEINPQVETIDKNAELMVSRFITENRPNEQAKHDTVEKNRNKRKYVADGEK